MRKIIGKDRLDFVPIDPSPNGCICPQVVQIRDLDVIPKIPFKCRDVKTQLEMRDLPVTFRFCECVPVGHCKFLPPTVPAAPAFLGVYEGESFDQDLEGTWQENGNNLFFFPSRARPFIP